MTPRQAEKVNRLESEGYEITRHGRYFWAVKGADARIVNEAGEEKRPVGKWAGWDAERGRV